MMEFDRLFSVVAVVEMMHQNGACKVFQAPSLRKASSILPTLAVCSEEFPLLVFETHLHTGILQDSNAASQCATSMSTAVYAR